MSKVAKSVGAVVLGAAAVFVGAMGFPQLGIFLMQASNYGHKVRDVAGREWIADGCEWPIDPPRNL